MTYGSQCGQSELVTILPYTNVVAGWNHVSADLLSIVNYIEQTYGTYLDLEIRAINWNGNTIWLDEVDIHQYLIGEDGYFINTDHLGTPQVMTDSTKNIVWQADYMPFGDLYQPSPNITLLNFRFPGQYKDLTNLYQNGFRDYSPMVGRYMEADPIGLAAINLYIYGQNNPLVLIDPFGLFPDWLIPPYGKYGGPGRTGKWAPQDAMDNCFKIHDECYENAKISDWNNVPACDKKPQKKCDEGLYECLTGLPISPFSWDPIPPYPLTQHYSFFYRIGAQAVFWWLIFPRFHGHTVKLGCHSLQLK